MGSKRNKVWIWTAVNHKQAGILAWVSGDSPKATLRDRSAATFETLWLIVKCWQSFFYVTDGWKVYPMFIEDGDQIVSTTYMTRVESENTRLRHYLARLHRKTLCYSKSALDAEVFPAFTASLLKVPDSSPASLVHYTFSNAPYKKLRA